MGSARSAGTALHPLWKGLWLVVGGLQSYPWGGQEVPVPQRPQPKEVEGGGAGGALGSAAMYCMIRDTWGLHCLERGWAETLSWSCD